MTKKGSSLHTAPASKESEMMVLGCMLTSSSALSIGADGLEISDFYYSEHQIVFKALKMAFASDRPADVHLISESLKNEELLPAVGGIAYLTELAQYAGTSAYIEEYVEIIRKKSILRQMSEAAKKIERIANNENGDVFSSLDEAQSLFFQISQSASKGVGVLIQDLLNGLRTESRLPYLKELQERQEKYHSRDPNEALVVGLPSGFTDLDKLLNGFNPSNLIILAGRPSMGKTALAMNIAEHVCFDLNMPVGIFSLEMTAEEILHRMICGRTSVESDKIKMGSLDGNEYQKIVEIVRMMSQRKLIIDDQPGMKITDLRARARRMKEVHGIKFIVIDYLQLLSGAKGFYSSENRQNEISEISRMLKNLARELEVPVLCLSQLSRKVEERAGHRPMLSDLRESGSIEQDADIVSFVFRREYYNANDKPGTAEVIVAKNRHGAIGDVMLAFRKKFGAFGNYTSSEPSGVQVNDSAFAAFDPF
jgi:replicative DNA helicase